jgi:hypothetical protein
VTARLLSVQQPVEVEQPAWVAEEIRRAPAMEAPSHVDALSVEVTVRPERPNLPLRRLAI